MGKSIVSYFFDSRSSLCTKHSFITPDQIKPYSTALLHVDVHTLGLYGADCLTCAESERIKPKLTTKMKRKTDECKISDKSH